MGSRFALLAVILGVLGLALFAPSSARADDGKALYETNCAKCHGPDGRGDTPVGKALKAKSLADPKFAAADSADMVVSNFRANPKHKPIASNVTDDDLRAIAVYLRTLASTE